MASLDYNVHKLDDCTATIMVHFTRGFRLRQWIAVKLIVLAYRILGADTEVIVDEKVG